MPYPPLTPLCGGEQGYATSYDCVVGVRQIQCLHPDYLGHMCLIITRPFYSAFIRASCFTTDHVAVDAEEVLPRRPRHGESVPDVVHGGKHWHIPVHDRANKVHDHSAVHERPGAGPAVQRAPYEARNGAHL